MTSPSRLGTLKCEACNGKGAVRESRHQEEHECPDCETTGHKLCEACPAGERREAVGLDSTGDLVCYEHWQADRREQRKAGAVAFAEVSKGAVAARARSSRAATPVRQE